MWQALFSKNLKIFLVLLLNSCLSFCSLGGFRGNILHKLKEAIHYGYFSIWLNAL